MQWATECVNHCFAGVPKQDEWRPCSLTTHPFFRLPTSIIALSPAFMFVWVVVNQVKISQDMLLISSPTYLIFFIFPCHCSCQRVKFFPVIKAWEMCCQSKVDIISFATCTYTCIMHHIAIWDLRCCIPDHRMVTSSCVFHRRLCCESEETTAPKFCSCAPVFSPV